MKHLVECLISDCDPKKRHISKRNGLPNIILSTYFEGCISKSSQDTGFNWSGDAASIQFPYHSGSGAENKSITTSTRSELDGFIESFKNFPDLPYLINIESTQILSIIDLLREVSSPDSSSAYQSLDEPGRRYSYLIFLWFPVTSSSYVFLLYYPPLIDK